MQYSRPPHPSDRTVPTVVLVAAAVIGSLAVWALVAALGWLFVR